MFHSKVIVTLKKSILDPQGKAVEQGIHSLGFNAVGDVRIGKYIEMNIDTDSREEAERMAGEISDKLLANLNLVKTKLEKKKFLNDQFTVLKVQTEKLRKNREQGPIVIEEEIVKGTKVMIDNHSYIVQIQDKGVVFYLKSFIIMGKKDKEWGKIA